MKRILTILAVVLPLFCQTACCRWYDTAVQSDDAPSIFPDYKEVTVPCNIAPLNFMVEDADRILAVFICNGTSVLEVKGPQGILDIPQKKWREMLEESKGGEIEVEVSVWNDDYPQGISYKPFSIRVSEDEIDAWVAYRLIEPGYVSWRQLGIYQRDLTSFREKAIVTNRNTTTTCLNCHSFPAYSPESMMLHARGNNGGTILYHNGDVFKADFSRTSPIKSVTYPAWHPDGRYIAFSANTTHQVFFAEGRQPIEVFDTASDLVIYDTVLDEVITDSRFMTAASLETFPSWSSDGKYLYFASYTSDVLPVELTLDMQYDLLRVEFDPQTGRFGELVETIYDASEMGGSISHPRLSPDGHHLLYTIADYGTFPVWHREADLQMLDIRTMELKDISVWNDADEADSYHSWSSNGRWVVYGSRRLDGRYTRLFIAHMDEYGCPHKPFLMPQKDPRYNVWRLRSFNVPELVKGEVTLPQEVRRMFMDND